MPAVRSSIYNHIPPKTEDTSKAEFKIEVADHFKNAESQEIVLFEEDTKRYYKLALYDNEKLQQVAKQLVQRIPLNHRVISTTGGEHFVIGGIHRDKNRYKASHEVYRLVEEQEKSFLEEVSPMNYGHAMHGACQKNNHIYVISGT
jgi:hypothetical protein